MGKATLFIRLCLAGLWLVLTSSLWAAELNVRSAVDKTQLAVGEEVAYELVLEWHQSDEPAILVSKVTPPSSELMELIDTREVSSSKLVGEDTIAARRFAYRYRATGKGQATFSPAVVEYTDMDAPEDTRLVKSREHRVQVVSVPVRLMGLLVMPLGIIAMVALGAIGAMLFVQRRRTRARRRSASAHAADQERAFLSQMENAHRHRVGGDVKAYYTSVKDALFGYVQRKHGLACGQLSPDALRTQAAQCGISADLADLCVLWSEQCERVRFSGYVPGSNEVEQLVRTTRRYFTSLIPKEDAEAAIETVD